MTEWTVTERLGYLRKWLDKFDGADDLKLTVADAIEELEAYDHSFELFEKATTVLTAAWQEAHPDRSNVWPDLTELCTWAAERIRDRQ